MGWEDMCFVHLKFNDCSASKQRIYTYTAMVHCNGGMVNLLN